MADTGNPKAFFTEALEAFDALSETKNELSETVLKMKENEKTLNQLEKSIEKEKTDLVKRRRADIESEYQKQLNQAEAEITSAKNVRSKAREQGVKTRIGQETEGLNNEVKNLKESLRQTVQMENLPGICRRPFFYTLFHPAGIGEVLGMLLVFAIFLILVPGAVTFLFGKKVLKIVSFVVIDAVFIAIYVIIYHATVGKHQVAAARCREIVTAMKNDKKVIKKISGQIQKDKNDAFYNLADYDAEIAKYTDLKNTVILKRQEALAAFDSTTAPGLKAEIDAKYAAELEAARLGFSQTSQKQKNLSETISRAEMMMNSEFTQYIGKENMNHEKLAKMIVLVENGEASGVQDAVTKAGL